MLLRSKYGADLAGTPPSAHWAQVTEVPVVAGHVTVSILSDNLFPEIELYMSLLEETCSCRVEQIN